MGLDYSNTVYAVVFAEFARPCTINPIVSQPSGAAYGNRCIWHSDMLDFMSEAGALVSDQRTSIDIREEEYPIIPQQGDQVTIPPDLGGEGAAKGTFEVTDVSSNGGGETTLMLKKIELSAPTPPTAPGVPVNVPTVPLYALKSKY